MDDHISIFDLHTVKSWNGEGIRKNEWIEERQSDVNTSYVKVKCSPSLVSVAGCSSHWRSGNSGSSSSDLLADPSGYSLINNHREKQESYCWICCNTFSEHWKNHDPPTYGQHIYPYSINCSMYCNMNSGMQSSDWYVVSKLYENLKNRLIWSFHKQNKWIN